LELIEETTDISVTVHGLRRTFATAADAAGVNEPVIAAMLNHSQRGSVTAKHYIIKSVEQLREPMQRTTDQLKKWVKP
jgi:integrase